MGLQKHMTLKRTKLLKQPNGNENENVSSTKRYLLSFEQVV